jgi:hypothetical protein
MTGLGILMVKIGQSNACFNRLLEFRPWDIEWDGSRAVFRKIEPKPRPTSYGHVSLKLAVTQDQTLAELKQRSVPWWIEARGLGVFIPTIDDPEGNMIELLSDIDDMPLPPDTMCDPSKAGRAIALFRQQTDG